MFKIPANTFYDIEDSVDTRGLALTVLNLDGSPLDPHSWVKFVETNQTLIGLPTKFSDVGASTFLLEARDSADRVTRLAFRIFIQFTLPPSSNLLTQTFDFHSSNE